MKSAIAGLIVVALGPLGCGSDDHGGGGDGGPTDPPHEPEPFVPTDATRAYCQRADGDAVEARIDALLRELTLEDKVAMMSGTSIGLTEDTWLVPGDEARGVPGLQMLDGPRGLSRFTMIEATAFPVAMARGATWDPALEERVGAAMGRELRSVGADTILAPTINVLRHPRWGRAQETYGEDVHHMGVMGVAFVRGAQQQVIAVAKHFAANSIDDTRFRVNVTVDERTLREVYLPHFRRAVRDAGVGGVMSAYNRVNGVYCAENPHLLSDILKGEWEFSGFVVSDWALGTRSTAPSVMAGLDIEMPIGAFYGAALVRAVRDGEVDEHAIDRAVRRIVRAQLCFALDTDPPVRDPAARGTAEHAALAREVAERSLVLLKNDGALLPLDRAATASIVVAGPLADAENIGDLGSSAVLPTYVVTALQGITDAAPGAVVTHVPNETLDAAAEATVAAADVVVVVVGLTSEDEGEGLIAAGDRDRLPLSDAQQTLVLAIAALNPRTVVVLEGGSAIDVSSWVDEVGALLMAWYPGLEGGHAIAAVLFGDAEPSGRLPVSFPATEADLPPFDNVSDEVVYDALHGYRHLQRQGTAPRFAFGFGLGYTTFALSDLSLDRTTASAGDVVTASVTVHNTGARPGVQTVQLYVGAPGSAVERAPRDLRGFAQIALDAGASARVDMALAVDDLAYYQDGWIVEALDYHLQIGTSAEDLPLSATLTVM